MGCMIVEAAVWVAFGERGRTNFRENRLVETRQLPDHRDLGHGDCFHDGQTVLQCIAQDIIKNMERDGRRSDTITPKIVELMVEHALIEKQYRDRAAQLLGKMKRKVFTKTIEVVKPDPVLSPPAETLPQLRPAPVPPPQQPPTRKRTQPIHMNGPSHPNSDAGSSKSSSYQNTGKLHLTSRPVTPRPQAPPSNTDMRASFPKVTIDELVKWIEDTKFGIIKQLPGWDSAKQLLRGRDFVSTSACRFPLLLLYSREDTNLSHS